MRMCFRFFVIAGLLAVAALHADDDLLGEDLDVSDEALFDVEDENDDADNPENASSSGQSQLSVNEMHAKLFLEAF